MHVVQIIMSSTYITIWKDYIEIIKAVTLRSNTPTYKKYVIRNEKK